MGINVPNMGRLERALRGQRPAVPKREAESPGSSLADALFTTTQQRVLALLFGQPDRSYFATELIALAMVGSGAVQRELKKLAASGLVTVSSIGKQKHYQANHSSPVFAELCGLVNKTVALEAPVRSALEPFRSLIRIAAIYGSIAKHADTATSDIDLLVVSDDIHLEQLYTVLAKTEDDLSRKINPTLYTSDEFERRRRKKGSFIARVLEGEHVVLIGDEVGSEGTRKSRSRGDVK